MGIGVNASNQVPHIPHSLPRLAMAFIPDDVSQEMKDQYASFFKMWVITKAFQDIVDVFGVFLSDAYRVLLLVDNVGHLSGDEINKVERLVAKIKGKSIADQWKIICSKSAQIDGYYNVILSLKNLRNCLTHRGGVVGKVDVNFGEETFVVSWIAPEIIATEPNGSVTTFPREGIVPKKFDEGAIVSVKYVKRSRSWNVGESVEFSANDLSEILFTFWNATIHIQQMVKTKAEATGKWVTARPMSEDL